MFDSNSALRSEEEPRKRIEQIHFAGETSTYIYFVKSEAKLFGEFYEQLVHIITPYLKITIQIHAFIQFVRPIPALLCQEFNHSSRCRTFLSCVAHIRPNSVECAMHTAPLNPKC